MTPAKTKYTDNAICELAEYVLIPKNSIATIIITPDTIHLFKETLLNSGSSFMYSGITAFIIDVIESLVSGTEIVSGFVQALSAIVRRRTSVLHFLQINR